jgi:hypothetical protein
MDAHDAALARDVARLRELFEEGLDRFGGPWLAGARFTVLDAFYAPVAFRVRTYGLDVGRGQAWVEQVLAHPAMREWEAAGLAESWREVGHEEEIAAVGEVVADFARCSRTCRPADRARSSEPDPEARRAGEGRERLPPTARGSNERRDRRRALRAG